jgi:hypothetical protein
MSDLEMRHSAYNEAKPRSSLLVHTGGHEGTGLKTYRGPKRKERPVCSLLGYYGPEAVVKQRRLTSKVAIFASPDGLQTGTPREPTRLGHIHSWASKATRLEAPSRWASFCKLLHATLQCCFLGNRLRSLLQFRNEISLLEKRAETKWRLLR